MWAWWKETDLKYAVEHATSEDILNLFNTMDEKKTGLLSIDEIIDAAQEGKLDGLHHRYASHGAIRDSLTRFDNDRDNHISIEEFFEWIRFRERQINVAFKELEAHSRGREHKLEEHISVLFGEGLDIDEAKTYIEEWLRVHQNKNSRFAQTVKGRRFTYKNIPGDDIIDMFSALDTDGNGVITLDELVKAARNGKLGVLHHRDACVKYLEEADTNHDGKLTIAEFKQHIRKREVVIADLFWHMDQHLTGTF